MAIKSEIKEVQAILQDVERIATREKNLDLMCKVHRIHGEMYAYLQQHEEMVKKMAKITKEAKAMRDYAKVKKH